MPVHTLDPLTDSRWDDLVDSHPRASVFHLRGWLSALAETYTYEPIVLTSSPPGAPLNNALVLSRVSSWVTGKRFVSLPFSDHCDPLLNADFEYREFTTWLADECARERLRYTELRPLHPEANLDPRFTQSASFCFHMLDLTPPLPAIFDRLHKDSMQRRIRKAERSGLVYESGRSPELLEDFYKLLVKTRLRHGVLPQPRLWFRNLVQSLGDRLVIRVARSEGNAIASLITITHRTTAVYKYGCSDERYHNLAGMPFLFWKFFEESKSSGIEQIDLGRSDLDNPGLLTFKDRMGATRRQLDYFRHNREQKARQGMGWVSPVASRLSGMVPQSVLPAAGRLLYRHFG
jgi:hypothetical protein